MENPFAKRATEMLRDNEAFLSIVSPEPVVHFFKKPAEAGQLYDRLVVVQGTPGSGKTTLARLFEYSTLSVLLRNSQMDTYKALAAAMTDCGCVEAEAPSVVGCRLPLETDYRDIWEFPYPDQVKLGLLTALIQARAVLGWTRQLTSAGVTEADIAILPRSGTDAATATIGGTSSESFVRRARDVELSIYRIAGSLVPPPLEELGHDATGAYRPFDVIERFEIGRPTDTNTSTPKLLPLIILDDAHTLHPDQFVALKRWLMRRELPVARWVLTRLDILRPEESLEQMAGSQGDKQELPGVTKAREMTEIMLQSGVGERKGRRRASRRMFKDMANRYLRRMPVFNSRNLMNLSDLLSQECKPLPPGKLRDLKAKVGADQKRLGVSNARKASLLDEVGRYASGRTGVTKDIQLAMLRVLLHRYAKRVGQTSLLDDAFDPEPSRPPTADIQVYDAARLQLMHQYDTPYYFGINDLCDAGSENAEQFLRLASILVEVSASRLIRGKAASIDAGTQHSMLRERAAEVIRDWNFPQCALVRQLTETIAELCLSESLKPNAWLGAGANAYGVPQAELERAPTQDRHLALVLHYGIAYKAFNVVPHYTCKGKEWCLLELGGFVLLRHGLTLKRGGFIEGTLGELSKMLRTDRNGAHV